MFFHQSGEEVKRKCAILIARRIVTAVLRVSHHLLAEVFSAPSRTQARAYGTVETFEATNRTRRSRTPLTQWIHRAFRLVPDFAQAFHLESFQDEIQSFGDFDRFRQDLQADLVSSSPGCVCSEESARVAPASEAYLPLSWAVTKSNA